MERAARYAAAATARSVAEEAAATAVSAAAEAASLKITLREVDARGDPDDGMSEQLAEVVKRPLPHVPRTSSTPTAVGRARRKADSSM